jgi:enamine deaminase RidA (YjgF/YER057c/UK114 family)
MELVRPDHLYQDNYSHAAIAPPGGLIFTAGACPIDERGNVVGGTSFASQAQQAMANLVTTLAAAGADLPDVLKTTVYVVSAKSGDIDDVWEVVRAPFGDHDVPGTVVGVTVLGYEGQLVEIEAVALAS